MACSKGTVDAGYSKPTINLCTSVSGSTFNVSLEGVPTEQNPLTAYVILKIEREASNTDGWTAVSSPKIGYWANSKNAKTYSFSNGANAGKTMRITSEFYRYSDYTGKMTAYVDHMFYQG
ncbi:hypothetical protein [Solibacillus sp. FSL K6-1554]|uniref:hypothetical protein n=1 Tax=Solibacillus sp. FSL K6-1554 TaxID=2921472 RepID=UPI0030FA5F3C